MSRQESSGARAGQGIARQETSAGVATSAAVKFAAPSSIGAQVTQAPQAAGRPLANIDAGMTAETESRRVPLTKVGAAPSLNTGRAGATQATGDVGSASIILKTTPASEDREVQAPEETLAKGGESRRAGVKEVKSKTAGAQVWANEASDGEEPAAIAPGRSITQGVAQGWTQKAAQRENPVRTYVQEAQGGAGASPKTLKMAEEINEMMVKTAAPLTMAQVDALRNAPDQVKAQVRMEAGLMEVESLKKALQDVEAPMSERQELQLRELQMMREAIEEIKRLQKVKETPKEAAPAWASYPAGSQRPSASGWKTSTIGLYPEDYEKAYALMNYLRAQTGQNVNLSRVIKIALRAMEVGPHVLQINEEIRAKDGRLMSRRA